MDFDKRFSEFDRDFNRTKKFGIVVFFINAVLGLGGIGFVVWVIVKVMQYFGIV